MGELRTICRSGRTRHFDWSQHAITPGWSAIGELENRHFDSVCELCTRFRGYSVQKNGNLTCGGTVVKLPNRLMEASQCARSVPHLAANLGEIRKSLNQLPQARLWPVSGLPTIGS